MPSVPETLIAGQDCFLLTSRSVELAITMTGGHLAPVKFFPGSSHPVHLYAIALWAEEPISASTPPVPATLEATSSVRPSMARSNRIEASHC
jgi:hypothetical protein